MRWLSYRPAHALGEILASAEILTKQHENFPYMRTVAMHPACWAKKCLNAHCLNQHRAIIVVGTGSE